MHTMYTPHGVSAASTYSCGTSGRVSAGHDGSHPRCAAARPSNILYYLRLFFATCTLCIPQVLMERNRCIAHHPSTTCPCSFFAELKGVVDMGNEGLQLRDVYEEAIALKERQKMPIVGAGIDQRCAMAFELRYKDANIMSLVCCICANIFRGFWVFWNPTHQVATCLQ